ncbi:MAG: peptidase dimerization domain-containing protein, partial [Deltaproteobacteria bacterium]|nr:peptidase dimerization domain-containing protein [Deltaproteobacteria bacterium]
VVDGTLRVDILDQAHHCGMASGIVPSSFRIARRLLSRIEDEETGVLKPDFVHVKIPEERRTQLSDAATEIGSEVCAPYAFVKGAGPVSNDMTELLINNTWRPTLAVLAQDGLPPMNQKAHLLRSHTALELSFRFPPGVDIEAAKRGITELVTTNPPYGARVSLDWNLSCDGWNAPHTAHWFEKAMERASNIYFGKPPMFFGLGGAIPFINMLNDRYPTAQFLVSGVLGPGANAHGPNEFLHIPAAKKLTCCVAQIIHDHANR